MEGHSRRPPPNDLLESIANQGKAVKKLWSAAPRKRSKHMTVAHFQLDGLRPFSGDESELFADGN
jgi:hypothetical protein